ncbi:hypothetical protein ACSNKL_20330, partial [Proteus mirabilis]
FIIHPLALVGLALLTLFLSSLNTSLNCSSRRITSARSCKSSIISSRRRAKAYIRSRLCCLLCS